MRNAPFQLAGDNLTLPIALMSDEPKGLSSWRRLKKNVFSRIETLPCPTRCGWH